MGETVIGAGYMAFRDPRGRRSAVRPDLELNIVAEKIGIVPSYLSCILTGKKTPSMEVAERLAEVLGFEGVDELRGELEKYRRMGNHKDKRKGRRKPA